jgi:hypothetical protein
LFGQDAGDPLFPVRMALRCPFGTVRGWLLLGSRPDGSLYGKDELEALAEIAPPLRRALAISRHREREKTSQERRQRAASRSITRLASRMDAVDARLDAQARVIT